MKPYLTDSIDLARGSVDDVGDTRYASLNQNVPDGYVSDLQEDLIKMGFTGAGAPDGAFGQKTKLVVQTFQESAGLAVTGIVDQATRDEILLWLQHGHTKDNPRRPERSPEPQASGENRYITPRVPHFSQGDPRWAARILGHNSTIQRKGCAITCVAMVLKFYGRSVTPGSLDEHLDSSDGYAADSVKWSVAGRFPSDAPGTLQYSRKSAPAAELTPLLHQRTRENKPTLVRVDYGRDSDLDYNHFVVCVGTTGDGKIIMNDPGTRRGDGYANAGPENVIETTTRKDGYRIVQLDWYDLAD